MLRAGDRVELSGGYEQFPTWLASAQSVSGLIARFIPGQSDQLAAVVHLDGPLSADQATGSVLVLELRYRGATWEDTGIVHVELCDFEPESRPWQERAQGEWIEAAASYRKVSAEPPHRRGSG